MTDSTNDKIRSGYQVYNEKAKKNTKVNTHDYVYPPLPKQRYSVLYVDPPWYYNGKMQFDRTGTIAANKGWKKDVFVSGASFKYPTIKTKELKKLDVNAIAEDDSLLFLWTTNPHLEQAIDVGKAWGFEYKTVAFVWNKMVHNPGQYTLSYCELCLLFKKGRIPKPRGARNIKQLVNSPRTSHSAKPTEVARRIEQMFPTQRKIELFARIEREGWESWGLETSHKSEESSKEDVSVSGQNDQLMELDL